MLLDPIEQEVFFRAYPAGAQRSPPEAPRGAPKHPLGEGGQGEQAARQVQHQHDPLPEEPRLGQVKVCQPEGKHSHTGAHCFVLIFSNLFLKGNLDPHCKHAEPS